MPLKQFNKGWVNRKVIAKAGWDFPACRIFFAIKTTNTMQAQEKITRMLTVNTAGQVGPSAPSTVRP